MGKDRFEDMFDFHKIYRLTLIAERFRANFRIQSIVYEYCTFKCVFILIIFGKPAVRIVRVFVDSIVKPSCGVYFWGQIKIVFVDSMVKRSYGDYFWDQIKIVFVDLTIKQSCGDYFWDQIKIENA